LGSSSAPTSPPAIRVIPHPPAAAPAAGGWGIAGSRRVYSVGSSRVLAGGAAELEAWPEWLLKMAVFSSGVGAPVEASFGSVVPASPASRRRRCACFPRAGDQVVMAPVFEVLEGSFAGIQAAVAGRYAWWRCSHRGAFDSLAVRGSSQSKVWRMSGRFRRRGVVLGGDDDRVQEGLSVIFFFPGLFCKKLG
jgi:hypothetical protein